MVKTRFVPFNILFEGLNLGHDFSSTDDPALPCLVPMKWEEERNTSEALLTDSTDLTSYLRTIWPPQLGQSCSKQGTPA